MYSTPAQQQYPPSVVSPNGSMLTMDYLNTRRSNSFLSSSSMTVPRGKSRRDSAISIGSNLSQMSRFSHMSNGKMSITLEVESLRFLKSSDEYDIKIADASVISLDVIKKCIRLKVKASKVEQIHENIMDDDLDSILDDIDQEIDEAKYDGPCPENEAKTIEQQWQQYVKKNKQVTYGSCSIGDCDCIERIAFILKYYSVFTKFKSMNMANTAESDYYYQSMTTFLSRLKHYSRIKLLNDYHHIRKHHMSSLSGNEGEKELYLYLQKKINACSDEEMCSCLTRNATDKEIYKFLTVTERKDLYWINHDVESCSEIEMCEIVLLQYLDIMHCLFLHNNATSDGSKFITEVQNEDADNSGFFLNNTPSLKNTSSNRSNASDQSSCSSISSIDYNGSKDGDREENTGQLPEDTEVVYELGMSNPTTPRISLLVAQRSFSGHVNANSNTPRTGNCGGSANAFGQSFDYWKSSHPNYVSGIYSNLETELVNNSIYKIDANDYKLLAIRAKDLLTCAIGKSMKGKREFRWMRKEISFGDLMSLEHIIAQIVACNFVEFMRVCKAYACHSVARHSEIAHFCKLLKESIWCFGDILSDKQRLYHGLSDKLIFDKCTLSLDMPSSVTMSYKVMEEMTAIGSGICLKMGKTLSHFHNMVYLDVSHLSFYPNEKERLIFGGNLGLIDLIYAGSSHQDAVMALLLHEQVIHGRWFSDKSCSHFNKKKYQRKIVKFLNNLMNFDDSHNVHHKYIQAVFEAICRKCDVLWLNSAECETHLVPELNKMILDKFVAYSLQSAARIETKFVYCLEMKIKKEHIMQSSFKKSIYSKKYYFDERFANLSLHFRCYRKFDKQKKEDMFRGFIATSNKLPKGMSKCELKYGLQFDQLTYHKWDLCVLSKDQLYKGSSLFKMSSIHSFDHLEIKIAFQVKAMYDDKGKLID